MVLSVPLSLESHATTSASFYSLIVNHSIPGEGLKAAVSQNLWIYFTFTTEFILDVPGIMLYAFSCNSFYSFNKTP